MATSRVVLPPLRPLSNSSISHNHGASPPKPPPSTIKPTSRSSLSGAQRWHHLSTRTPPTIPFIYGVLTTKIYCLPTCPSRLARRANITFFSTPQEAECEGFRACKRCKPDLSPSFIPARSGHLSKPRSHESSSNINPIDHTTTHDVVNGDEQNIITPNTSTSGVPEFDPTDPSLKLHLAISLVKSKSQSGEKISLGQLAQEVGLSKWHLQRAFKRRCGRSPREMGKALLRDRERRESAGEGIGGGENTRANGPEGCAGQGGNFAEIAFAAAKISNADMSTNTNAVAAVSTDAAMPPDPTLHLWNLNTQWETRYNLANSLPSFQHDTGSGTPTGSDRLTESSSSHATTPLMSDMDFSYDTNFYPEGFSPDIEGVLRDLFPEIYDENAVMKGQDCFQIQSVDENVVCEASQHTSHLQHT